MKKEIEDIFGCNLILWSRFNHSAPGFHQQALLKYRELRKRRDPMALTSPRFKPSHSVNKVAMGSDYSACSHE